ncbi:MAG: FHA domain-containing protein [Myxococcales bacterium]|nr:FHA domain-containing protein [Myxococcales bacterium]
MDCVVCRATPAAIGLLCDGCRDDVAAPLGLLPQQVLATIAKPTDDALVDQWGQAHRLEARTIIGRTVAGTGIMILEASVSRHHAHLTREPDGWKVRDLGSANGTFLNDAPVTEPLPVRHGDRIAFGAVGFYLVEGLGEPPVVPIDPAVITTIQAIDRVRPKHEVYPTTLESPPLATDFAESEVTDSGLPLVPLAIVEPTGGGGGVLEIAGVSLQLSQNQVELITTLAKRMRDEAHQPAQVRGFVRSSELISQLSWDTRDPDDTHLKQLVRRARRQLLRAGLGDLIESRQRFGYRLRMIPQ